MWSVNLLFLIGIVVSLGIVLLGLWFDHRVFKRVVIVQMSPGPLYLVSRKTKMGSNTWTTNIWEARMYTWNRAEFPASAIKGNSLMVIECWQVNRIRMWLHRLVGRPTVDR
jgi:hypothetical protein